MRSIIIPAAGLAARMKPLSRGVSKTMIPVNGRPIITYVLDRLLESEEDIEIIIVENKIGDIRDFVSRFYSERLTGGTQIHCIVQEEKKGPLHAIEVGSKILSKDSSSVSVWLGDTICLDEFDWSQDFLAVHKVSDPHRWCLVDTDGFLYDKPEHRVPTESALIGVYNFVNRSFFNKALILGMKDHKHKGEHQISSLLKYYMHLTGRPMVLTDTDDWYDCGELNTYYESKARLLSRTSRSFNHINVDTFYGTITKTSEDAERQHKIGLEADWFRKISEDQSLFCPRVLDGDYGVLKMSMEPGTALNEVLVYDNLRTDAWYQIIRKILKIHHDVFLSPSDITEKVIREECSSHYRKNADRMNLVYSSLKIEPGVRTLVDTFISQTLSGLESGHRWSKVIHGDSHLGNIIYEPYSGNIKFVDPRGSFGNLKGTEGDMRYDMAKLLQDFYCGYSMILADRYWWESNEVIIEWVPGIMDLCKFLEEQLNQYNYNVEQLKKLSILLLFTAIPFHADAPNRQKAMFFTGLNLINHGSI